MQTNSVLAADNSSKEEDARYVEPEKLNLEVLRTATNNFSEENKLGEGGFGEVFKVHFHRPGPQLLNRACNPA
jgi:hypothetical protein